MLKNNKTKFCNFKVDTFEAREHVQICNMPKLDKGTFQRSGNTAQVIGPK